jgi:hypothetical protein
MTTQEEVYMQSVDKMEANHKRGYDDCVGVACGLCPVKEDCDAEPKAFSPIEAVRKWKATHNKPRNCTFGELGEGEMFQVTGDQYELLQKTGEYSYKCLGCKDATGEDMIFPATGKDYEVTRVSIEEIIAWRDGEGE